MFLRFNRKAIGILAIVSGVICFLVGGGWCIYSYHFNSAALRATGRVVQLVKRHDDQGDSFYPVFEYTDKNGVAHTVDSDVGSYPAAHQVGDAVIVLYLPGAEGDARLGDWFGIWGVPMVLGILGVVYLPLGIVMCMWPGILRRVSGVSR